MSNQTYSRERNINIAINLTFSYKTEGERVQRELTEGCLASALLPSDVNWNSLPPERRGVSIIALVMEDIGSSRS